MGLVGLDSEVVYGLASVDLLVIKDLKGREGRMVLKERKGAWILPFHDVASISLGE